MKSRTLTWFTAMTLFAALAIPVRLIAQHTRYELIDLGTLGGPASFQSAFGDGEKLLDDRGIAAGNALTSTPDPNCTAADCFISHPFRWQKGVLTDLGALPGGNNSSASAINARGWVVGGSEIGQIDPLTGNHAGHAVLWKEGEMIDLGTLGTGLESNAVYVNNGGEIIGYSTVDTTFDPFGFPASVHPFLWKNGVMHDLGTLGGPDAGPIFGGAGCTNEREDLVAFGGSLIDSIPNATTGVPTQHAFVWENGTLKDIPTLGGTLAWAQCANNRGQVIGQSSLVGDVGCDPTDPSGTCLEHPFLWDHGILTDLGTLGADFAVAFWLNDDGEAVGGSSTTGFQEFHATLWKDGRIKDLGAPAEDCTSVAFAVNPRHQIVGRSFSCDFSILRAVLWEKNSAIDLNDMIPANASLRLVEAVDINSRGEIFGRGLPPGCDDENMCGHDFLLIPCNHAGVQGCEGNDGISTRIGFPVITTRTTTPTQRRRMTKEFVAQLRARLAHRYHIPALAALPRD